MFKSIKKRPIRKRRQSDSDGNSDEDIQVSDHAALQEMRRVQKLRKRVQGVTAEDLAQGLVEEEKVVEDDDPFKMKTGGYIDMKALKNKKLTSEDIEQIGTSFAAETNRRDEDADMLKYVQEEMKKRKGIENQEVEEKSKKTEDTLYELPENLKNVVSTYKKRSEDMLSNQMLSGIPEVDLGIEAKIKNIEQTEEAKARLLEQRKKANTETKFIPTNMAVNFVQHNRFNIEESYHQNKHHRKKVEVPAPEPVRVGDADRIPTEKPVKEKGRLKGEKATDDFHFEKFKKQLRRY